MRILPKWQTGKMVLRLALGLVVLLLVVTGVTRFLLYHPDKEMNKLGYKTAELSIQVLLVVIAGGLFVQEYNRGQARRTAVNEFRKTILRDLIEAYSNTKKARRILRAKCLATRKPRGGFLLKRLVPQDNAWGTEERALPAADYDEQLGAINETQLSLEIMARELRVFASAFGSSDTLRDYVSTMEKYLGKVISEYERTLGDYVADASIPLSRLTTLGGFIAKSEREETFSTFSGAFHQALDLIQEERVRV